MKWVQLELRPRDRKKLEKGERSVNLLRVKRGPAALHQRRRTRESADALARPGAGLHVAGHDLLAHVPLGNLDVRCASVNSLRLLHHDGCVLSNAWAL